MPLRRPDDRSAVPLRVLFLADRDWRNPGLAGGDVVMWEGARYLAHQGHAVTVVASTFPGADKEEAVEGVRVVRLGRVLSLWLRSFLYYVRYCRGQFDVVITEGFGGSRIPRLAPLYVRVPLITQWHQLHHDLLGAQYPRWALPALDALERLTAFVHRRTTMRALSPEWQQAFLRLGFQPERIFVVPPCLRDQWLQETPAGLPPEPAIVWLGKFRRYKRPDHVIAAMRQIVRQVPAARLILAGRRDDHRYEQRLQRMTVDFGLSRNVQFLFDLTEEEKRQLLKRCRALVLPSPVEGFGIVALEANACGVPVIASSGVPESAVRDGHNGLRYPFSDIDALVQRLLRVLLDDALHRRLSRNGVRFARQHSWRKVGPLFERVVDAARSGREPRAAADTRRQEPQESPT